MAEPRPPTPPRQPGRARRPLLRWGAALLAVLLLGAGLAALRAPQLFVLAAEGPPRAAWPAAGRFALVRGVPAPAEPATGARPPEAALARFAANGGRALLVDRGGALAAEAYGPGLGRDTSLNSFSLVKGLVGALALRAVADGRIGGLDAPLRDLLGPDAPAATLREALTMTSGLALPAEPPKGGGAPLDDAGWSPFGPLARLHAFGVGAMLPGLRVDEATRGEFHYQSANTALIGLAVERAYGRPLPELLADLIWRPAGAADARWRLAPGTDEASAYCCLYARPLDWLRVGRFLLDNGTPEAPFLPEPLWRDFLLPDLAPEVRRGGAYGLHARHDVLDRPGEALRGPFAYFLGHGGQMLYVLPGEDMVVVRFGAAPQLLHSTLYDLAPP